MSLPNSAYGHRGGVFHLCMVAVTGTAEAADALSRRLRAVHWNKRRLDYVHNTCIDGGTIQSIKQADVDVT